MIPKRVHSSQLTSIDRKIAIAFSGLVFFLMLTVALVGTSFVLKIAERNEEDMEQMLASVLADSINRISFSGKYHARLLIERIQQKQTRIRYIFITENTKRIIAHSDSSLNGKTLTGNNVTSAETVLKSKRSIFRDTKLGQEHVREIAFPYRSGFQNAITGVIFIGIDREQYVQALTETRLQLTGLVAFLLFPSLLITLALSAYFAGPVKSMAWQLRGILEHAPLLIKIVDDSGNCLATSDHFDEQSDTTKKQLKSLTETRAQEVTFSEEGTTRSLHVIKFFLGDSEGGTSRTHCSIALDTTTRRHAIEALQASEAKYRKLLENLPQCIFIKNIDGEYVSCNANFASNLGVEESEIIGKSDFDFFPKELAHKYRDDDQKVISSGVNLVVEEGFVVGDQERIVHTVKTPVRKEDGTITGILGIFWDVTEEKRAEEKQREFEEKVRHTQKLESIGVLAGGIAHDFNNLLTAILANASLSIQGVDPDSPAYGGLQEVISASRRAADLCQQMLAYSGQGKFVIEPISLTALVKDMANIVSVSISKKAELKCSYDDNLPLIEGDPAQVRQVILNLLMNASDALGDDAGEILVSTGTEEIDDQEYVYFDIKDTGCGMDEQTKALLFEPFYTTKFQGRGLGLSAVLGIMRGHGGSIDVKSNLGQGTTFRAYFPVKTGLGQELPSQAVTQGDPLKWRHEGLALIVDDEEIVRLIGKKMLKRCGFSVELACDGEEALERIKELEKELTVIVMDVTMPKIDGCQVFAQLRKEGCSVPIILTSGFNSDYLVKNIETTCNARFLHKPFEFVDLVTILAETLDSQNL